MAAAQRPAAVPTADEILLMTDKAVVQHHIINLGRRINTTNELLSEARGIPHRSDAIIAQIAAVENQLIDMHICLNRLHDRLNQLMRAEHSA